MRPTMQLLVAQKVEYQPFTHGVAETCQVLYLQTTEAGLICGVHCCISIFTHKCFLVPYLHQTRMVRKSISFESQGLKCAAYLYLPDTEEKRPVIVMAHGLGGIREMRLDSFAEEFCKVGYACVLFDYRYFGASEGTPRQLLDIESQIQDWKAAIDYARHYLEVDHEKVIIWGSSFSGGHVIRLASEDKNIFAAMSQCPFTDGFASAATSNLFTSVKLGALAIADLVGSKFGRDPIYVPLAGEPSLTAFMTAPDCLQGYLNLVPDNEDKAKFENKCAARLALQLSTAFPGKRAKDVECPILDVYVTMILLHQQRPPLHMSKRRRKLW